MSSKLLWVGLAVVVLAAFYLRNWQCAEMFPNANRVACILWK